MEVAEKHSGEWLAALRAREDESIAELHALLLRAARFEVARRRPTLPHLRGNELDDIAQEAADDALMSILGKLDDFRGESRFTTWAYKFALLEAAVKLRRRAWQGRELPLEPETWGLFESEGLGPEAELEQSELLQAVQAAIAEELTPRQREVLVALALNGVPIDVLAERMDTTRAASCAQSWRSRELTERPELKQALGRLLGPAEPEVGCDACFDELDRYVELELAGKDADSAVPGLRAHLDGCPACREEHESLRALVGGEQAL
jgi:RNA polymerase sigma-70 factor (ECF subfamily)